MNTLKEGCVFCEIIKKDDNKQIITTIPTPIGQIDVIVIEPYNPCVEGHLLFIPNIHAINMKKSHALVAAATAYAVSSYSKKPSKAKQDYNLIVNNGVDAGQTVPHMHFHYIPRRENDDVKLPWSYQKEQSES